MEHRGTEIRGHNTDIEDAATGADAAPLTNTATYSYVWDQVGSIRLVTDGAAKLITLHDYEPYGVEILPNNPTSMPTDALPGTHLYTGQERDADTKDGVRTQRMGSHLAM